MVIVLFISNLLARIATVAFAVVVAFLTQWALRSLENRFGITSQTDVVSFSLAVGAMTAWRLWRGSTPREQMVRILETVRWW
jgi:hypothetical protein